jgi:AAA domain
MSGRDINEFDGSRTALPSLNSAVLPLADWLERDLPPADPLLGRWLTTTSRILFSAPTGAGKTMLWVALGMAKAGGLPFLRWQGRRPCRVLYVDGEVSRRLLKQRLADEARRLGTVPSGLNILAHEDVENFAPLNTPEGKHLIEAAIAKIGGVDSIIFDNVMSLISGDMREEDGWRQTLDFQHSLTRRKIAQVWLHHTGHDETKSYGTKTREWQMDTVLFGERLARPDTDVSMKLTFRKARERTPLNRADFADITVALIDDVWTYSNPGDATKTRPSPLGSKFLDALVNALAGEEAVTVGGHRRVGFEIWKRECHALGLIDLEKKAHSGRTLFAKYRRELIDHDQIACNEDFAWAI